MSTVLFSLLALAAFELSFTNAQVVPAANCSNLHIIIARGSTESQTAGVVPGGGTIGHAAAAACKQVNHTFGRPPLFVAN